MLDYLKYLTEALGMPSFVLIIIASILLIAGIAIKVVDAKKKIEPEAKNLKRKIEHRKQVRESIEELPEIKTEHQRIRNICSDGNVRKLKDWCSVVDDSVKELTNDVTALRVQSMRKAIIDFSHIAWDDDMLISREEFMMIFNMYEEYEDYITKRGINNGVVDCAYQIIKESFEDREERHFFTEYRMLERRKHKE